MADDAAKKPMRFDNPPEPDPAAEFARMPVSPAEQLKQGGSPTGWSPGLGVGTASNNTGKVPWPPAKQPPAPFRNLSSGRK